MVFSPAFLNALCALCLLIGLAQCFLGYRLFKVMLGAAGFLVGAALAGGGSYALSQSELAAFFAGVIGGAAGACLAVMLYFFGVFLFGAFLGGVAGAVLCGLLGFAPSPLFLLIPAAVTGVLAVVLQKFMIVASTAFGGAWNVVMGAAHFVWRGVDPIHLDVFFQAGSFPRGALVIAWLILGAIGFYVQYTFAPKERTPFLRPDSVS